MASFPEINILVEQDRIKRMYGLSKLTVRMMHTILESENDQLRFYEECLERTEILKTQREWAIDAMRLAKHVNEEIKRAGNSVTVRIHTKK
jgi:hypothetical protein